MQIFLDLDDTLLNTTQFFLNYHDLPNPYADINNRGRRDPHTMLGMDWEDFWFNLPIELWASIPKYPWADQLVEWSQKLTNTVYFMSSPIPDGNCSHGKQLWVNTHYAQYSGNLVLAHHKEILVDKSSQILIDDSTNNEKRFEHIDKSSAFYLFPAQSNRLHERYYQYIEQPHLAVEDLDKWYNQRS